MSESKDYISQTLENGAIHISEEVIASIVSMTAQDVDGVKRRTRSGMGRCQGGFCSTIVLEILARELKLDLTEVTKFGGGSVINYRKTKGGI